MNNCELCFNKQKEIEKLQSEVERLQNYVIFGYEQGVEEVQKENTELRQKLKNIWKEAEEFYLND